MDVAPRGEGEGAGVSPPTDDFLWKAVKIQARYMDTAGNIASANNEYELANRCWALSNRLHKEANAQRLGTPEPDPDGSDT